MIFVLESLLNFLEVQLRMPLFQITDVMVWREGYHRLMKLETGTRKKYKFLKIAKRIGLNYGQAEPLHLDHYKKQNKKIYVEPSVCNTSPRRTKSHSKFHQTQ